jgi:phenylpropionate dioxygenase-like ring-hydroxylating dioxygenase large terminal subunit
VSIIEHEKYFTSLPREYYLTEERYQQELVKIWQKQWVYVGHVSQIRAKGDYFTYEIGDESVVVIRGEGDQVHTHMNVCRHRGLRLCDQAFGQVARRLVCPYHSWSYDLDGTLKNATRQADGEYFDYKDYGLINAHVEVWLGFIFVCLADETPGPIADMIDAKSTAAMELVEPLKIKVAHEVVYDADADWKLLLENGVECYHCPSVHPEFCVSLNAKQMSSYYDKDMVPNVVQGLIIPVQGELESLSMDGHYVSKKLLGKFDTGTPVPYEFGAGFMTQPGYAWAGFHPDYGMVANCLPAGPGKTKMVCQWFVHEDAVEGVDYDIDELIMIWDITNNQDLHILTRQQAGLRTTRYTPGPNSYAQEPGIHASLKKYLEMMGEAN